MYKLSEELYQYQINILHLSLRIRFACRVFLEFNQKQITEEVTANEFALFIFDQQCTLRQNSAHQSFDIAVMIKTDKGAQYVGGIIKLSQDELSRSEGDKITLPVIKCLDKAATVEIAVDQVQSIPGLKGKKSTTVQRRQSRDLQLINSAGGPLPNEKQKPQQTKSEANMPQKLRKVLGEETLIKPRKTHHQKTDSIQYYPRLAERQYDLSLAREFSTADMQIYRQSYAKLKEKSRKEAEVLRNQQAKRDALQNNENNYKLQILRLKLKCEQLEKHLQDKNKKNSELHETIIQCSKKEFDFKYLKEENAALQQKISSLEQTIKMLNNKYTDLKLSVAEQLAAAHEATRQARDELFEARRAIQDKQNEHLKAVKEKDSLFSLKDVELNTKVEEIKRLKICISDLEEVISNNMFEAERLIKLQRVACQVKVCSCNKTIEELMVEHEVIKKSLEQKKAQVIKLTQQLAKLRYQYKFLEESHNTQKAENSQMKQLKVKSAQMAREIKEHIETNSQLKLILQKSQKDKNEFMLEQKNMSEEIINRLRKSCKETEAKNKTLHEKVIELENICLKGQINMEEAQRIQEESVSARNDAIQQLKQAKKTINTQQLQINRLKQDKSLQNIDNTKEEYASRLQVKQLQADKVKLQEKLSTLLTECEQLNNASKNLRAELGKTKQDAKSKEEFYNQQLTLIKTLLTESHCKNKELNEVIEDLKRKQEQLGAKETELNKMIKKKEEQIHEKVQLLSNRQSQLKQERQKLSVAQNQIKVKVKEIEQRKQQTLNQQSRATTQANDKHKLQQALQKAKSECGKQAKIIELLQADAAKFNRELSNKIETLQRLEETQSFLRKQVAKSKQDSTRLEMKNKSLEKEAERLKQSLIQSMSTVFAAIPDGTSSRIKNSLSNSGSKSIKYQSKESSQINILKMLEDYGREAKTNMNKTLEQLKQLQRENKDLNEAVVNSNGRCYNAEVAMNQNIQKLQEEKLALTQQREAIALESEERITEMKKQLNQKQLLSNSLQDKIEGIELTLKNFRLDFEAEAMEWNKKDKKYRQTIKEMKDIIQEQNQNQAKQQQILQKKNEQINEFSSKLREKYDELAQKVKVVSIMEQQLTDNANRIDELRLDKKLREEKLEEEDMRISVLEEEVRDLKNLVTQESTKATQLREFISNLLIQKQEMIKQELRRTEELIKIQAELQEAKIEKDRFTDMNSRNIALLEDLKEGKKKQAKTLKEEEQTKQEEKIRAKKLNDRLVEKEKACAILEEELKKLQNTLRKSIEKHNSQIKALQKDNEEQFVKAAEKEKEFRNKITILESDNDKLCNEVKQVKADLMKVEEQSFNIKTMNEQLNYSLRAAEKENNDLKIKLNQMENLNKDLIEQLKQKQEGMFEISSKAYNLELRLEQAEVAKGESIEGVSLHWKDKFQSAIAAYEQREEASNGEKVQLRNRLMNSEDDRQKLKDQLKLLQAQYEQIHQGYQAKFKSMQDDQLSMLAQKNIQIQRLGSEIKAAIEALAAKDTQCNRLRNQYANQNTETINLQLRYKQVEEKLKRVVDIHNREVERHIIQSNEYQKQKQAVRNFLWRAERDIRRIIQTFVRSLVELASEKNLAKIMQLSKDIETNVVNAMTAKTQLK